MHPQASDKRDVCTEFFRALEACHANYWLRYTGGCNTIKSDLNMCLRKDRIVRTDKNREEAKLKREKLERAWQDLHKDD